MGSTVQFLDMISLGWKTGNPHRIEIWFVEYNEKYYILSELETRAHWVQNISHNPQVSVSVNGLTFEGTAHILDSEKKQELATAVRKLMEAKYQWSGGLIVELVPA